MIWTRVQEVWLGSCVCIFCWIYSCRVKYKCELKMSKMVISWPFQLILWTTLSSCVGCICCTSEPWINIPMNERGRWRIMWCLTFCPWAINWPLWLMSGKLCWFALVSVFSTQVVKCVSIFFAVTVSCDYWRLFLPASGSVVFHAGAVPASPRLQNYRVRVLQCKTCYFAFLFYVMLRVNRIFHEL